MSNISPVKLAYKLYEPVGGADKNLSPIIFLHGITGTKKMWKDIPQIFADRTKRKAYALDSRNHGETEYTDIFSFDLNVTDLLHFLDTIHAPKAILVGHSMGGITSIRTALKTPERVEKIVVEDMYTKNLPKEAAEAVCGYIGLIAACVQNTPKELSEEDAISFAIDLTYSKIPPGSVPLAPKETTKTMGLELKKKANGEYDVPYNKEVIFPVLQSYEPTSMAEVIGEVNGPALFIYGEVSPFNVGKEEDHIKTHFPKAELAEVKGAAHCVHSECPEEFTDTVLKFLLK